MRERVYQLEPIAPLLSSDGIASTSAMLRFEYFEAGPNTVTVPPATEHNLAVNFSDTAVDIEYRRNNTLHQLLLAPGGMVATPAGIATSWRWRQPVKVGLIWVDADMMRQFLETQVGVFVNKASLRDDIVVENDSIFGIATRIKQVVEHPEIGANALIDALSRALVVMMLRHHQAHVYPLHPANSDLDPGRFRAVFDMVQSQLADRVTLEDMSKAAGMSRSHFAQAFKALTHKTPMQFVMEQRLYTAQRLLRRSALSIGQIASQSGFADQAHLTKKFKAHFGQTPSQFRKTLRVQTIPNVRRLEASMPPHIRGEIG
ncbi:MAG: AraC family transcriptional regulator [Pseudomonadota bacterium]